MSDTLKIKSKIILYHKHECNPCCNWGILLNITKNCCVYCKNELSPLIVWGSPCAGLSLSCWDSKVERLVRLLK